MEVSWLEAPYIDILDTRKLRIYTPITVKARLRIFGGLHFPRKIRQIIDLEVVPLSFIF